MFPKLEESPASWIEKLCSQDLIVTCTAIQVRALNLIKTPEFADKKPSDFVPSVGWCNHFMSLHKFCARARTKLNQKLPSQLEDKVEVFQWYIIQVRKKLDFDLSQIGNMDKTPI